MYDGSVHRLNVDLYVAQKQENKGNSLWIEDEDIVLSMKDWSKKLGGSGYS